MPAVSVRKKTGGALDLKSPMYSRRICQAVDVDPESGMPEGPSLLAALATSQQGSGKGPTFGVLLRLSSMGCEVILAMPSLQEGLRQYV